MSFVRKEILDRCDRDYGLLIKCAFEDEQTGEVRYQENEQTKKNREEIDRRKGRKRVTFLGQLPVYAKIGKERETLRRVEEIVNCMNIITANVKKIEKNNKKLGYVEGSQRRINLGIEGRRSQDNGILRVEWEKKREEKEKVGEKCENLGVEDKENENGK